MENLLGLTHLRILSAWIPRWCVDLENTGERATLTNIRLKRAWMYSTTRRLSQTQHQSTFMDAQASPRETCLDYGLGTTLET